MAKIFGGAPLNNPSTALEASKVVHAGRCLLTSINVLNTSGGDLYLQLFDATTLPPEGTVPNGDIWKISAGELGGYDYGSEGKLFRFGVVAVLSSTGGTKTIAGSVGLFFPRYKID